MLRDFLRRTDDPAGAIQRSLDPDTYRLALGGYELDSAARREVKRILQSRRTLDDVEVHECSLKELKVWQVSVGGDVRADVVVLPPGGIPPSLPTASEVRLVQAADRLPKEQFDTLLVDGGLLLFGQDLRNIFGLTTIFSSVRPRGASSLALLSTAAIDVDRTRAELSASTKSVSIFSRACNSEPIKYHFLEVYRSMEIQFLHEIMRDFQRDFFLKPKAAADAVKSALGSEVAQMIRLSQYAEPHFEQISDTVERLAIAGNTLAQAIKAKHMANNNPGNSRSQHGAVFVYYARCSIVHAGDKDIIYDEHVEADSLVESILLPTELAALEIAGFRCI